MATRETWKVENLDKFDNYRIDIYDRTGKLIHQTNDASTGWDGKYRSKDMPSTDYWYVITVHDTDTQYKGHFLLLRGS